MKRLLSLETKETEHEEVTEKRDCDCRADRRRLRHQWTSVRR